jgi:hypothetical protein
MPIKAENRGGSIAPNNSNPRIRRGQLDPRSDRFPPTPSRKYPVALYRRPGGRRDGLVGTENLSTKLIPGSPSPQRVAIPTDLTKLT